MADDFTSAVFYDSRQPIPSPAGTPEETSEGETSVDAMSREELQAAFTAAYDDAAQYIDDDIAPQRALATSYARGDLFGDEVEGKSKVVMTEVRDAVLGILPSLLRIFTAGEHAVEFVPANAASVDQATQQTDYVNYVFYQDNPGFLTLHSVLKDALYRKIGVIKWRWSEDTKISAAEFTGLLGEQAALLLNDPTVSVVENVEGDPVRLDNGATLPTYNVKIRRVLPQKRLIVEALPPEEYLCDRNARDANSPRGYKFQAHRSFKPLGDLVAMGFDRDELEQYATGGDDFETNEEAVARNPATQSFVGDTPDPSMRDVLFIEAYMYVDADGDGIPELRRIYAVGEAGHVLEDEIVEEAPFAVFCADPEPHMVVGNSVSDQTMDLQRIKTNIMRGMLDSLTNSLHPRTVIVDGQVNVDDALSLEDGAMIRAKAPGMVQELTKPFNGQAALPVLAYVDQTKSKRTGLSDATQGLDPSALQSTTHSAVQATVTGAQERIELYARCLAETGLKRMFSGIARCLRENQDFERVVKLTGEKWVPVDPRSWIGDLECTVNVALGRGTDNDKIASLTAVLKEQKEIMQVLGPVNPLAGIDKYRATLAQLVNLAGFKDASRYFGDVPTEYVQMLAQPHPQPPSPQLILANAEAKKIADDTSLKLLRLQQEQLDSFNEDQRAREKMRLDALTALATAETKAGASVNIEAMNAAFAHVQAEADRDATLAAQMHANIAKLVGQMHANMMAQPPQPPGAQPPMPPALPMGGPPPSNPPPDGGEGAPQ